MTAPGTERRSRRLLLVAALRVLALATWGIAGAVAVDGGSGSWPTFSFYVTGSAPSSEEEEDILQAQLRELNHWHNRVYEDARFLAHVGSMIPPMSDCSQDMYASMFNLFLQYSPLAVLPVPGDDDWARCPSPDVAWSRWEQFFLKPPLEGSWWAVSDIPESVERQYGRRENFAFMDEGVLFVGVNAVGSGPENNVPEEERQKIQADDVKWVREQLRVEMDWDSSGAVGDDRLDMRAVVVFGHSTEFRELFDELHDILRFASIPVVYIHGHGSEWEVDRPYASRGWDTFWTVQVDRDPHAPPLRVTVKGDSEPGEGAAVDTGAAGDPILLGDVIELDRRGFGDVGGDRTGGGSDAIPMPTEAPPSSVTSPTAALQRQDPSPTPAPNRDGQAPTFPTVLEKTTTPPLDSQPTGGGDIGGPAAPPSPTDSPVPSRPSFLETNVILEISSVRSIMNREVLAVFESTCELFLSDLFKYTVPPVWDVGCTVKNQSTYLATRRRRRMLSEGDGTEAELTLVVDLIVSGTLEDASREFDFGETVLDFFNVMNGQLLALLREFLEGSNEPYFEDARTVSAVEHTRAASGGDGPPLALSGGEGDSGGGGGMFSGLGLALVILGVFVVAAFLAVLFLFQRQRRMARRYADVGSAYKYSMNNEESFMAFSQTGTPPTSPGVEPPSIVLHEDASEVDSMSRLQDFESITDGAADEYSSSVTPGGIREEDSRTESSSPSTGRHRKGIPEVRTDDSAVSGDGSLPTLASGAPPSLAGGGASVSDLSRGYSTVVRSTAVSVTSVATPSGPPLTPNPPSLASPASASSGSPPRGGAAMAAAMAATGTTMTPHPNRQYQQQVSSAPSSEVSGASDMSMVLEEPGGGGAAATTMARLGVVDRQHPARGAAPASMGVPSPSEQPMGPMMPPSTTAAAAAGGAGAAAADKSLVPLSREEASNPDWFQSMVSNTLGDRMLGDVSTVGVISDPSVVVAHESDVGAGRRRMMPPPPSSQRRQGGGGGTAATTMRYSTSSAVPPPTVGKGGGGGGGGGGAAGRRRLAGRRRQQGPVDLDETRRGLFHFGRVGRGSSSAAAAQQESRRSRWSARSDQTPQASNKRVHKPPTPAHKPPTVNEPLANQVDSIVSF